MFWTQAWAQGATAAATPSLLEQMMPFVFIFVIFYFVLIRPQAKKQRTHNVFLQSMKRGDAVLTTGGILGTIEGLTDQFITLGVASGVRIRVLRSQIASPMTPATEEKK